MTALFRRRSLRALALGTALAGLLLVACGKKAERPPSLPSTRIFDRNVSRAGVVDLVVNDKARAGRVQQLYLDVEELMFATRRLQVDSMVRLMNQGPKHRMTDAQIRSLFADFRDAEQRGMTEYIRIQMRLRKELTAEEFAKLDKVR